MSGKEILLSDFLPVSTAQWESLIIEDLKGADYNKKLVWESSEGIKIKPYYRKEDLIDLTYLNSISKLYPNSQRIILNKNNWLIRQNIKVNNPSKDNKKALDILSKGVNSILFEFEKKFATENLITLLNKFNFECIELSFIAHEDTYSIVNEYIKIIKNSGSDLSQINGTLGYYPIENLVIKGNFYFNDENKSFNQLVELFAVSEKLPNLRLITVNGKHFQNAGGNLIQELAFSLAMGNEYLARLTDLGIPIDKIAKKIDFSLAIGSNFFFEIAKIRATRILWTNIVNAYNPESQESCQTHIHAETSLWNKTLYDPYVNILRSATESMAATLGGVDSLTVNPYNLPYENINDFSERIARNQQLILSEEAYFSKVIDPSAGSYFIETLTNEIAEKAWKLFLEIEKEGGFIKAFINGIIHDKIRESAQKKDQNITYRKEILLGTNQYPNLDENIDLIPVTSKENAVSTIAKPLKIYRGSIALEEIRLKTGSYSKNNKRPAVFLLTYGDLNIRRARAQFVTNFFGCAGFDIIDNIGFNSITKGLDAAIKTQANIFVFCSSDDEYNEINSSMIEKVNNKILVIAGYPKDLIEKLYGIGITHFMHIKSNMIEELKMYQDLLNI